MATVDDTAGRGMRAYDLPGPRAFAALALLAANAGMLYLYFALDLTLFQVIVVYWWEALWIGLFGGLKLVTASLLGAPWENRWIELSKAAGILLALVVIVKSAGTYFSIVALTGVALVALHESLTGVPGNEFVAAQGSMLLKCSLLFATGHGLSFAVNFLALGEARRARAPTLLWLPFRRALALFAVIVASLATVVRWPGVLDSAASAALVIVLKLAWDFFLHRRERDSLAATTVPGRGPLSP